MDVTIRHSCSHPTNRNPPLQNPPPIEFDGLMPPDIEYLFRNVIVTTTNCADEVTGVIAEGKLVGRGITVVAPGNPLTQDSLATCSTGSYEDLETGDVVPICGIEAQCSDVPMWANGGGYLTTISCACPWPARALPPKMTSTSPALVPYIDGCLTPTRARSVSLVAEELSLNVIKLYDELTPLVM